MRPVRYMGKIRGHVQGDTYISEREPEHYFVRYRGFGISSKIVNHLSELKIQFVSIIYHRKKDGLKIEYRAPLNKFVRRGRRYIDNSEGNKDLQYILPVKEMEVI